MHSQMHLPLVAVTFVALMKLFICFEIVVFFLYYLFGI